MNTLGNGLKIIGSGTAIADQSLTNQDLSAIVETSDEWIKSRTGMRQRYVCSPGENLANLGIKASQNALAMAGLGPQDIDLIILATSTPDDLFGTAAQIQGGLGPPGPLPLT